MLSYIADLDKRMFYRIVVEPTSRCLCLGEADIGNWRWACVSVSLCWVDADTLPRAEPVQSAVGEFFD